MQWLLLRDSETPGLLGSIVTTRKLQSMGSVYQHSSLVTLQYVGSSRTKDQTSVDCTTRQILNQESPLTPHPTPPTFHIFKFEKSFALLIKHWSQRGGWKSKPANAGAWVQSHQIEKIPHAISSGAHVPHVPSLCSKAPAQQLLKPACPKAHALQQQKPLQ